MSEKDFKKELGNYWKPHLKLLPSQYRKVFSEGIRKLNESDKTESMANQFSNVLIDSKLDYYKEYFATPDVFRSMIQGMLNIYDNITHKDPQEGTLSRYKEMPTFYISMIYDANEKGPRYAPISIAAIEKLSYQDPPTALTALVNAKETLNKMKPAQNPSIEDFLLAYVHDQHSAHIVGQVIDKTKYGKQYAEKVAGFY